jgi:hypothetical protein
LTDFAEDFDASITSRDPGVASSHKILLAGLCGLPARSGRWNKKPTARPRAPITYGVDAGGALGRAHLGRSARPDELDPHFARSEHLGPTDRRRSAHRKDAGAAVKAIVSRQVTGQRVSSAVATGGAFLMEGAAVAAIASASVHTAAVRTVLVGPRCPNR